MTLTIGTAPFGSSRPAGSTSTRRRPSTCCTSSPRRGTSGCCWAARPSPTAPASSCCSPRARRRSTSSARGRAPESAAMVEGRIDVLRSSRHVVVRWGDVVVADSTRRRVLLETGLPIRWYLPREDAGTELLEASYTTTRCPYKGVAQYWTLRDGDWEERAYPRERPACSTRRVTTCRGKNRSCSERRPSTGSGAAAGSSDQALGWLSAVPGTLGCDLMQEHGGAAWWRGQKRLFPHGAPCHDRLPGQVARAVRIPAPSSPALRRARPSRTDRGLEGRLGEHLQERVCFPHDLQRGLRLRELALGDEGRPPNRYDVLGAWRDWPDYVTGEALECGHFLPEEQPERTLATLRGFPPRLVRRRGGRTEGAGPAGVAVLLLAAHGAGRRADDAAVTGRVDLGPVGARCTADRSGLTEAAQEVARPRPAAPARPARRRRRRQRTRAWRRRSTSRWSRRRRPAASCRTPDPDCAGRPARR